MTHHFFLLPDVVKIDYFFLLIGKNWEGEVVFFGEFIMAFDAVRAHAKNYRIVFAEILKAIADAAGFFRATGRIVFGIKIQEYPLAMIVGK